MDCIQSRREWKYSQLRHATQAWMLALALSSTSETLGLFSCNQKFQQFWLGVNTMQLSGRSDPLEITRKNRTSEEVVRRVPSIVLDHFNYIKTLLLSQPFST